MAGFFFLQTLVTSYTSDRYYYRVLFLHINEQKGFNKQYSSCPLMKHCQHEDEDEEKDEDHLPLKDEERTMCGDVNSFSFI